VVSLFHPALKIRGKSEQTFLAFVPERKEISRLETTHIDTKAWKTHEEG
jgi:hypothetical protein